MRKTGVLLLILVASGFALAEEIHTSAASPNPSVSGSVPEPGVPLTAADSKNLLKEFTRAQEVELKALKHRDSMELSQLKADQKTRLSNWDNQEKDSRHKFFASHPRGSDRRAYIGDYMSRRKAFVQSLDDERAQRLQEQDQKTKDLLQDQTQRLNEFKAYLLKGERPPAYLWPSG